MIPAMNFFFWPTPAKIVQFEQKWPINWPSGNPGYMHSKQSIITKINIIEEKLEQQPEKNLSQNNILIISSKEGCDDITSQRIQIRIINPYLQMFGGRVCNANKYSKSG